MSHTGYHISYHPLHHSRPSSHPSHSLTTGNITHTTLRKLHPNTTYLISISALNENQQKATSLLLDKYGRRRQIQESHNNNNTSQITTHTLGHDVTFTSFDANSTRNSGAINNRTSLGPTGVRGGEGHYGLILRGSAHVENCNASRYCCDEWDGDEGACRGGGWVCRGSSITGDEEEDQEEEEEGGYYYHQPGGGMYITSFDKLLPAQQKELFDAAAAPCGPALRLTGSYSYSVGATWYPRELEVGEGFDTTFRFRISNPSFRCDNLDRVHTHCRSRGADGLAFVIQASSSHALGTMGHSLGYGTIPNSLAVEFDTYYNYELFDPYENHVSIHTRGYRHPNDSNHTYSLGHTNEIPDLTNRIINARVRYLPRFFDEDDQGSNTETVLSHPSFRPSPYLMHFFENADYPQRGRQSDWGKIKGVGLIYVYVMDMIEPVLIAPLHLEATLKLNHGRAWVGFTAATGVETWQVHDVLDWTFDSLRLDEEGVDPTTVW